MIKHLFNAAFKKEYFKIKRIYLLGIFKTKTPHFSLFKGGYLLDMGRWVPQTQDYKNYLLNPDPLKRYIPLYYLVN